MRTIPGLYTALAIALATATPGALAHWPGQPPHQMAQLGDLQLEGGGVIGNFRMSYVTHGTLNAAKDNTFAQEPAELRVRKIGHVILNTATDRPWSQYFCCMVVGNRDFVRRHPVATKRVSILKAADICAADPERVARFLVDMRYETRYPIGLEVLKGVQFARWRETDPEDTLRFHALRLREAGMLKSTPQKLIAQGTDWRFLNELKRELKA